MKKLVILLLVFAMLICVFAACDSDGQENTDGSTSSEGITEDLYLDNIPNDLKFNGEDVVVLSRGVQMYTQDEIAVPELNSEPVNDAVFNRNIVIGDRLNVNIVSNPIQESDPFKTTEEIERVVKAGGRDYDLFAGACYVTIASALKGTFYDLNELEYLDLSQNYWMQDYNDTISYGESQFTATGVIALSTYRLALVTLFDKKVFDDKQLPYLYEAVEKNEWTIDYHASIVEDFYQDLNGNSQHDEDDLYGHVTSTGINTDAYWSACGVPLVNKDTDGTYVWVVDTEKLSNVVDKVLKLFYESGGTYICLENENNTAQPGIREMFAQGRAATATLRLLAVELDEIRNMQYEYGIVPMPKYDTAQKEYATQMHDQFTVFAVPSSAVPEKLELIGAVMEVMASENLRIVKPAYYELAIKRKYMSDPVAWDMLDLAFENVIVDAGVIYADSLDYPHHKLRTMIQDKKNATASEFGKLESKMNKQLDRITSKLDDLVDAE